MLKLTTVALTLALLAAPLAAEPQPAARIPRIGYLSISGDPTRTSRAGAGDLEGVVEGEVTSTRAEEAGNPWVMDGIQEVSRREPGKSLGSGLLSASRRLWVPVTTLLD